MQLREVIGRRRSIRFLRPYQPVEPEKIQCMLEAARIASHWGNVQSLRALVVFRDTAPPETIEALQGPVAGWQLRLAPVTIVWYIEPGAVDEQGDRLHELMDVGALGFGGLEARRKALDSVGDEQHAHLAAHTVRTGDAADLKHVSRRTRPRWR